MVTITFAIATYNDARSLERVFLELDAILLKYKSLFKFFVLFVDDGSTDSSLTILKKYQQGKNYVEIYVNPMNLGFGATFKTLFTLPKTKWIFFNTGDNQFPMDNFERMKIQMENADIIVGTRKLRKDNWRRKVNSKIYNWIVNFFLKQKVKDVNSILLFKRSVLNTVQLNGSSAFVNAELILKADRLNYKIKTCEIDHLERKYGSGSGGKWNVIYPTMYDFLHYILFRK